MTSAEATMIHAVSPVSAFSGAAAAGAVSAAGACAAISCTNGATPPTNMTVRQIRTTGRNFFILLIICDDIFVSFHPLVQDEVINTFLGIF
jgi:hypothetical protein